MVILNETIGWVIRLKAHKIEFKMSIMVCILLSKTIIQKIKLTIMETKEKKIKYSWCDA
jgi:hypothetical protein